MHAFLRSEEVTLHMIFAAVEHHLCTLGIDVEIAVFAAYRAIAVGNFLRFDRWCLDFVLDGSTVAVGFVPNLGWNV